jgi:Zn-dependent protease
MTRMPGTEPAQNRSDPGKTDPGHGKHRLRIGGIAVRLTAGGYVLATLAALAGAQSLPSAAPGWQPAAYVAAAAGVAILLTASLAGHELAHGLAARRHGVEVSEVSVGFSGGTWHGSSDLPDPRAAGRVAAAGPLASLVLAAISAGVAAGLSAGGGGRLVALVFAAAAGVNSLYGGLALLPAVGSDGGRIIRAVVWARTGDPARASVTAARTGQVTGLLLAGAGLGAIVFGYLAGVVVALIGFLVMVTSRSQVRRLTTRAALSGLRVRDILPAQDSSAAGVQAWLTVQSFVDDLGADASRARATAFPLRDLDGRPAGLLTVGHALVLAPDGTLTGVITPADMARAGQLGLLRHSASKL